MPRQRERVMLLQRPAPPGKNGSGLSRNRISAVHESKQRFHRGAETLLDLQRSHGNAFVQRKLAVSHHGDSDEQKADGVADAVVRNNDPRSLVFSITRYAAQGVYRMCPQCEEEMQRQAVTGDEEAPEEEEEKLQRQVVPGEEEEEPQAKARSGGAGSTSGETEIQREPLGRKGGARKTHVVKRGESLSLIAGYPSDGWRERLDELIAANQDHPNIKNRTPDDPRYGWLEIGDVINIPLTLAPLLPPEDITCGPCRDDWETIVRDDHNRALSMLDTAISKLASYDGTNPTDVKDALERRFEESSSAFATWINLNLRLLRLLAPMAGYLCRRSACGGMCSKPNTYGWTPFCIPFTSIRVCEPFYFGMNDKMRSMGLIHEWAHKYGCNFDFGYCSGSDCPGGTTRSLFNADPWAKLVLDIG